MSNPNDDFNSAKWVADFVTHFLQNNLEKIYGKGKQLLRAGTDEIRLLTQAYTNYLSCVAERYSQTRSFLIRDESIELLKFYVPLGVSCGDKTIPQVSIHTLITNKRFAVITGSGGSGKSMIMRYLFLDAIKSKEKVPIFVELRDINDSDETLINLIKRTLTANKFGFDDEYIEKALKAGLFAILLDGYDEVINVKRKHVAKEIEKLTQDYDRSYIIVSSRPDLEFGGWQPFKVYEVSPLTLEQACGLIAKIPGDEELKAKFTRDLQEKLFEEHESFLSNPLLLSIMLLTYKDKLKFLRNLAFFISRLTKRFLIATTRSKAHGSANTELIWTFKISLKFFQRSLYSLTTKEQRVFLR